MGIVLQDLEAAVNRVRRTGVAHTQVAIDPGLGFGKRKEENARLLAKLGAMTQLDLPIITGPSRKSFLGQSAESDLLMATAAAVTASVLAGAHMVRVHDVKEIVPVVQVADAILRAGAE
jgi:dihydropteroate synthase